MTTVDDDAYVSELGPQAVAAEPAAAATLLHVADLRAGYGPVLVLHSVSLSVGEGEVVVVLGANGAGKTTTMRAISGTIPRLGEVDFAGRSILKASPDAIVRAGIAQVPQGRGTFPELSVEDNLRIGAYTQRGAASTRTSAAGSTRSLASRSARPRRRAACRAVSSRCSPSPER